MKEVLIQATVDALDDDEAKVRVAIHLLRLVAGPNGSPEGVMARVRSLNDQATAFVGDVSVR